MNSLTKTLSLAAALLAVSPNIAFADEDETRISLSPGTSYAQFDAFAGEGSALLFGGKAAYARGLRNWFELGIATSYHFRSNVRVDGASINGIGTGAHNAFTKLHIADAAVTARIYLEIGPFLRLRPLLGFQVGGQFTGLSDPELFLSGLQVTSGDSDWSLSPYAAAEAGLSYRLSDGTEIGLVLTGSASTDQSRLGIHVEFSWMRD